MVSEDHSSPNAPLLSGGDGVVQTGLADGATVTELLSGGDGFAAEFRVWKIFREEHLWQPFTRYFSDCFDFEEKFAVWMSVVEHRL